MNVSFMLVLVCANQVKLMSLAFTDHLQRLLNLTNVDKNNDLVMTSLRKKTAFLRRNSRLSVKMTNVIR